MSASRIRGDSLLAARPFAGLSQEGLLRGLPSLAAGAIAVVLLLKLAWNAGGYFPGSYLGVGSLAFAALAVILIARAPHYTLSTPALVGLLSLLGLVVWTALSARWSPSPDRGLEVLQRDLVHVALFGLGLLAAGSGRFARQLVWAMLAVVVLVIGAGLVARLFPQLIGGDLEPSFSGYRLEYPLSYWNAYGGLAAVGTVLALGLCADAGTRPYLRALTAASAVAMLLGLYLSFSRGAWLALMAGLVLLLALAPRRAWLVLTAVPTLAASALAIALVQRHPELVDSPAGAAGQAAAGSDFAPILIALIVVVAVVELLLDALRPPEHVQASLRQLRRSLAAPTAVVAVVGVIGLVGLGGLSSVDRFVNRQIQDFLRASTPAGQANPESLLPGDLARGGPAAGRGNARLTNARGTRSEIYRVALGQFSAHPVVGAGAGSFEYAWYRHRGVQEDIRNAHSWYLETLAETGLVGGLLLAGFVGSLVMAAVRARARPRALRTGQASAVAAAVGVWLVHASFDWDWQITAFTGIVLVLAAAMYPEGRRVRVRRAAPASAAAQPQAGLK